MPRMSHAAVALCAGVLPTSALAQELVGPTDAWFGIDNLEVTYSGGTQLFDVRFDRRSFDDVFGSGTPDIPFSTQDDIGAAFTAIADFFNGVPLFQNQLRPIIDVAGGQDRVDNLFLPLVLTSDTIVDLVNVDDGGPTGWQYDAAFDVFNNVNIDRTQDLVAFESDSAWAVFTVVPAPASGMVALFGLAAMSRRRR